jgi:hypothetical protein
MAGAISDYKTMLCVEGTTAGKYHKLVDILSAPATGSSPKSIDVTTLTDDASVGIPDRPDTPNMEFEFNFNKTDFATVTADVSLTTDKKYMIVYQDGSGWTFSARGNAYTDAVSKGKQITAKLSLVATTVPLFVPDTSTLMETGA